jgi:hypothetical protein
MKRHSAATLVKRWLVNPDDAGEASPAQRKESHNGSKEEGESQRQGQEESQEEEVTFFWLAAAFWLRFFWKGDESLPSFFLLRLSPRRDRTG